MPESAADWSKARSDWRDREDGTAPLSFGSRVRGGVLRLSLRGRDCRPCLPAAPESHAASPAVYRRRFTGDSGVECFVHSSTHRAAVPTISELKIADVAEHR